MITCTCGPDFVPGDSGHFPECPMITGVAEGRLTGEEVRDAEIGTVELTRTWPPLFTVVKAALNRRVKLHLIGGMQVAGKVAFVSDESAFVTLVQGEHTYHVDLGTVSVLEEV